MFFQETVLGILIYAVVLGFFEDYTNILSTWSYSVTFFVAVVMQLLTAGTFYLKKAVARYFKEKKGTKYKVALVFSVWFILFSSKFVFLAVIDGIFGDTATISGFIGLLIVIATMTIVRTAIEQIYKKLA